MKQETYRQGDTLLRKVDSLPNGLIEVKKDDANRIVLAHGERTGHAHAFREDYVQGFYFETADRDLARADGCPHYIAIGGTSATLKHEHISGLKAEHDAIMLPSGIYESAVQVEESAEFLTQVAD